MVVQVTVMVVTGVDIGGGVVVWAGGVVVAQGVEDHWGVGVAVAVAVGVEESQGVVSQRAARAASSAKGTALDETRLAA